MRSLLIFLALSSMALATEIATLAAGCFWGTEEWFRTVPGVVSTRVGYMGGKLEHPTYNDVKKGATGHAEVCEVTFDPARISYEEVLDQFLEMHDPTQVNRQGPDIGEQYRSEIFYHNEHQMKIAQARLTTWEASQKKKVATKVTAASRFWKAEDYHQKYFLKNPDSPCISECHRKRGSH